MSTIEKLIAQIFDRKNSIIEQVRHQVELYDQQLASKLVIQGIDPPSWLWSHEAPSHPSDPSGIDKQRLVSELLMPRPQQPLPYFSSFNYNSISIPECNFDRQDKPLDSTCFEDVCYVQDIAKEGEPAATSPQRQVETRLDDGKSGLDLSRTEFKRSKSRQRALELRSSAKSGPKSHAQDGNVSVVSFRNDTPGMDEFLSRNSLEKPVSAKYLNIQLDDNAKCEGTEHKSSKGYENSRVSPENACSKTGIVGAVFSEHVVNSIHSGEHLNMHQEGDAESVGIEIQSCNIINSSGSMPVQHLHHGKSVDRMCKSNIFSDESSGRINRSKGLSDNIGICQEDDVKPQGIDIRWTEDNNTTEAIPNERVGPVCGSVDHVCGTKNIGSVLRGQIDEPTQFQETFNIQLGDFETKSSNTICSKEDNTSEAIPSRLSDHGLESAEQNICCTTNVLGIVTGCQIDDNSTEEIHSAVSHGNCSPGAENDVHNLSTTGDDILPSRINNSEISSKKVLDLVLTAYAPKDNERSSAFSSNSLRDQSYGVKSSDLMTPLIIGNSNSGMMKEQTDSHSSSEKILRDISANPVKTESSLRKNSELISNFPAAKNDGGVRGISLSCSLSQTHGCVLQSPQSASPAVIVANPKSTGVKSSEVHTSCCDLETGNRLPEEMRVLKAEAEVPQQPSETQSDLQKKDANLTVCHSLLDGVVQDQEHVYRVQSVSCNGTSNSEVSYHLQVAEDNIEEKDNLTSEATPSLLKPTTLAYIEKLGKVETESLRFSSHKATQAIDGSLILEKTNECILEGSHLSMDMQEKLNKDHSESGLEMESYATDFEKITFVDTIYDGLMDTDQSMPVLEGFAIDTDDGEFEESNLPGSTLKRVSFLERLCQSSSRNTPILQFPMTYGLHKTSDLFQSVPTGLLEHVSQAGDCSNLKLQIKSHSAGLPVHAGFNVSTPYASPFKKKRDHSTSSSGLRSQGSLNPELVCFTIEEDPVNCDEVVNYDEAAEAPPSGGSCLKSSLKGKPLTDITEVVNNRHPSVSVSNKAALEVGQTPKFSFRSQLDCSGTDANLAEADKTRARKKLGKKFSNKKRRLNDAKEIRNVSMGSNGGKQVTVSLEEAKSQKLKSSENLNITTGACDQPKVIRSNNIVSNISSFIPLVQQKKAAAVITGKRDVKVKALEAAEAAKRLAEKKENERKAKKEAWKAEKARLEQENLLQLELKKKKKEEELKKKEAEMAARKRIREEEEKKEKEGKRRRIDEARKLQHEQEKKQADKLNRHQADGLRIHDKDPNNRLEQCTKIETGGRRCRVTTENEDNSSTVPDQNVRTLTTAEICDSHISMVVSDFNATAEKNPIDKAEVLQSYDISPYQGSDDEDEDDENERRKEKLVPAWASKNSLAEAVFAQQHVNADEIFPLVSFCSIAEVLIPRKLPVR